MMLPSKNDVLTLESDAGSVRRVKVLEVRPVCRHYIVRDSKGKKSHLFLNARDEHYLVKMGTDER